MEFEFKNGTYIRVVEPFLIIERKGVTGFFKQAMYGAYSGITSIQIDAIKCVLNNTTHIFILGSGLPCPTDFKFSNSVDLESYPNCIKGDVNEINTVYNNLMQYLADKKSK